MNLLNVRTGANTLKFRVGLGIEAGYTSTASLLMGNELKDLLGPTGRAGLADLLTFRD